MKNHLLEAHPGVCQQWTKRHEEVTFLKGMEKKGKREKGGGILKLHQNIMSD